jgi:predicted HicB family RNase H-like nuclease
MLTLKDFMETVNYRITEGSDYCWSCYGYNAYALDSWNGDNDTGYSVGIVFDTNTQIVYEMNVSDYKNQRAYRWINSDFREKFQTESKERYVDANQAWDNVTYIDLETEKDMLEKTRAIVAGEDYDTRVEVPIELDDEVILNAALEAHKQDITLNQYIERILRNMIESEKQK